MKWISRLYIAFLGIMFTITTGYGVAAFYPEPQAPTMAYTEPYINTPTSCYSTPEAQMSPECKTYIDKEKQRQIEDQNIGKNYEIQRREYEEKNSVYTRSAIFFGISVGALYAVLGLLVFKMSSLISNGLLLAAVLTSVLTRAIVSLASLGTKVTGTSATDQMSYIQFGVLVILSIAVTAVGFSTLKENQNQ